MGTNKISTGTRTNLTTLRAGLGSKIRINFNYFNSFSFSFIPDKFLQLEKTPSIQPEIHLNPSSSFPDILQILQNNSSGIAVINYLFTYDMIPISLETSFPARNLFEKFSSRVSAFALESCSQSFEFEPVIFNLTTTKKLPVACYSNLVYSDINTNGISVATQNCVSFDIFGKTNMDKHPIFFIQSDDCSLPRPIHIFEVIIGNSYWNLNPSFDCSEFNLILKKSKRSLIKSERHISLKDRFVSFNLLDRFKSLRSNTISVYNELRRQVKLLSRFIITEMVKFVSVVNIRFKSLFCNIRNSFGINLHSSEKKLIFRDFQLDCSNGLHIYREVKVLYKPYAHPLDILSSAICNKTNGGKFALLHD